MVMDKKCGVLICSLCQQVIKDDPEWIKTRRGTVLYMHRQCVEKMRKRNSDEHKADGNR